MARYGIGGIGPHVKKRSPTEKLHKTYSPEHLRSMHKQPKHAFALFPSLFHADFYAMKFGILRRRHFFYFCESINHTKQQNCRSDIECACDSGRHFSCRGSVAKKNGEHDGRYVAHDRSGVAQETLYAIGQTFLTLVHHVANKHLEWLHGHVDAGVQEHQHDKTENNSLRNAKPQRTGIGKETHHDYCNQCACKEVGKTASETVPCAVAGGAYERLHYKPHQWGENPEITKVMRVCSYGAEYAAHLRALQSIRYLHAEKAETQIPQFPKT